VAVVLVSSSNGDAEIATINIEQATMSVLIVVYYLLLRAIDKL